MSVYTKTGDKGTTGLLTGERVDKSSVRVEAYGNVDEINSALGIARAWCEKPQVREEVLKMQKLLMMIMADLASVNSEHKYTSAQHIQELEQTIDKFDQQLPPLSSFLIPGGTKGGAALDAARTTARRAERQVWRLSETESVDEVLIIVLNRMSDLCFVLMRFEEH
ncbi:cob(I)yrinic acid a,c-diamide adenosyltransferase [Dendrosporobacter sp. 1207_IL3150]|uniref:cob(I)yrinic acid a,c-diamide adenosyltransferase n=1 Tax=Dendrosporobacter sp. 1207_IL3150 TaxID=3084054 RepID=UPI002FDB6C32